MGDLPQSQTQADGTAGWFPIKQILNRKVRDKQEMFLVQWDDDEQTETWVPTADVTDYAVQQYYQRKKKKAKTRCRKK